MDITRAEAAEEEGSQKGRGVHREQEGASPSEEWRDRMGGCNAPEPKAVVGGVQGFGS